MSKRYIIFFIFLIIYINSYSQKKVDKDTSKLIPNPTFSSYTKDLIGCDSTSKCLTIINKLGKYEAVYYPTSFLKIEQRPKND